MAPAYKSQTGAVAAAAAATAAVINEPPAAVIAPPPGDDAMFRTEPLPKETPSLKLSPMCEKAVAVAAGSSIQQDLWSSAPKGPGSNAPLELLPPTPVPVTVSSDIAPPAGI